MRPIFIRNHIWWRHQHASTGGGKLILYIMCCHTLQQPLFVPTLVPALQTFSWMLKCTNFTLQTPLNPLHGLSQWICLVHESILGLFKSYSLTCLLTSLNHQVCCCFPAFTWTLHFSDWRIQSTNISMYAWQMGIVSIGA